MNQKRLEKLLKTHEGVEATIQLLNSLHYAPELTRLFKLTYDNYTEKVWSFVRQIQSAIPESGHQEASSQALDEFAEDPGNLEEIQGIAERLEATAKRAQAIEKLKQLCERLLIDPDLNK